LAFKPDGSELLVAADTKIFIYDGNDGTLLQSLKGHKDLVYAVTFSHSGERFASGSADCTVIIWTEQHEGTLKYMHNEAIQCLAFSPVTCTLLSCSINDFGLWTQAEKNISKQRTQSRCTCCAWSHDGQLYAIGMFDGTILLRSALVYFFLFKFSSCFFQKISNFPRSKEQKDVQSGLSSQIRFASHRSYGLNKANLSHLSSKPVQASRYQNQRRNTPEDRFEILIFRLYSSEILAVGDWGQTVAFYDLEGNQVGRDDKKLGYDPTAIDCFNYDQFFIISGSNRQVTLYSREGITLGVIAQMDAWVWTAKSRPFTNAIVVKFISAGCIDGTLACYHLMFSTVHGLHKERYAYRENMTEVIVQHLGRQTSVRLKCNDLVRKVAVYKDRLAIQLNDRVDIYREYADRDDGQLEYKLTDRVNHAFDCSLLVICIKHFILCQESRLQCYDHKGLKQREWLLDSMIRYIKVIGGPPGRETIFIGLRNGAVFKIFVDNPFPIKILQLKSAIRCLDISHLRQYLKLRLETFSASRRKLAVVDEAGICMVFDITTKELLFQEPSCSSVAWNTDYENLLCYSGGGFLSIKVNNFLPYQQRMEGFVVGFSGKRVYCLHLFVMTSMEVPLSNQLYQYLEQKMYM
uniref:Intraflagellar transport protein 122 homolog n=1 Tax=Dracunculus medinensis TaxID=318479 RepID=A0A0N4UQ01_DRAME